LEHERSDGAEAFIPESAQVFGTSDDLAELLAEQYLREASGDESEERARDDLVPEELGENPRPAPPLTKAPRMSLRKGLGPNARDKTPGHSGIGNIGRKR
jgi:hypothetical protein